MNSRILAIAGVGIALLLNACGGGQSTSSSPSAGAASAQSPPTATSAATVAPTIAPSPTPAPQPSPTPVQAAEATPTARPAPSGPAVEEGDIRKMAEAWAAVKSYRVVIRTTSESDNASSVTIEVVRPDREHWKMTFQGQTFEKIQIGQDSYTLLNGKWTKRTTTVPSMAAMGSNPSETIDAINEDVKTNRAQITKGALGTVNGTPCQEWVYTRQQAEKTLGVTVCVGLQSHLPLQFKSLDGKATVTFQDWNAPISIEPPI